MIRIVTLLLSGLFTASLLVLTSGCIPEPKNAKRKSYAPAPRPAVAVAAPAKPAIPEAAQAAGVDAKLFKKGKEQYALFCTACHKIEVPGDGPPHDVPMLAPPAFAVADHYRRGYPDSEERVAAIIAYVKNPEAANPQMPGAIRRFGKMPALPLPDDILESVAVYLTYEEFSEPSWYRKHYEEEHQGQP